MKSSGNLITRIALVTTILLWGSAYVAIRAGLPSYSPEHLAVLRFIAASITFAGIMFLSGQRVPHVSEWPKLIGLGLIGMAGYSLLLNYGERRVTAGAASFLVNTCPLMITLIVWILYRERLSRRSLIGSAFALFGVFLVALGEEDEFQMSFGVLLVLLAASLQAIYFVLQKPLLKRYGALQITSCVVWAGALCLIPWSSGLVGAVREAPLNATLSVLYLGVFPGSIGYFTWAYVSSNMPVAQAATYLYLVPLVTLLIGWLWLDEVPHPLSIAGGSVALLGVALANFNMRQWRERNLR